jgi:hypothetical protein
LILLGLEVRRDVYFYHNVLDTVERHSSVAPVGANERFWRIALQEIPTTSPRSTR